MTRVCQCWIHNLAPAVQGPAEQTETSLLRASNGKHFPAPASLHPTPDVRARGSSKFRGTSCLESAALSQYRRTTRFSENVERCACKIFRSVAVVQSAASD